jgi:hypothetical protein
MRRAFVSIEKWRSATPGKDRSDANRTGGAEGYVGITGFPS